MTTCQPRHYFFTSEVVVVNKFELTCNQSFFYPCYFSFKTSDRKSCRIGHQLARGYWLVYLYLYLYLYVPWTCNQSLNLTFLRHNANCQANTDRMAHMEIRLPCTQVRLECNFLRRIHPEKIMIINVKNILKCVPTNWNPKILPVLNSKFIHLWVNILRRYY